MYASVLYNRLNNPDAETAGLLQVDATHRLCAEAGGEGSLRVFH